MDAVDGQWKLNIDSPMGKQEAVLDVSETGGQLTGEISNGSTRVKIQKGAVTGNELNFIAKIRAPLPMKMTYRLVVDGDSISGEVKPGVFGKVPVQGQRI